MFVKLELRVQGTHFYGDAGEFDGCRGINLGIWSQWLYHGTDDKLALVMTVASIVMEITGSLQQNRLIKSNQTFRMICIVII